MQHKVRVTVLDKKCYPELQRRYCQNPQAGPCTCYEVGDTFLFERYNGTDHFWRAGIGTLESTADGGCAENRAGGPHRPHCAEAWDAISRYIYTGLQGGSIMRGWMADDRVMIACCNDGTRPVIFEIRRLDYAALYLDRLPAEHVEAVQLAEALTALPEVCDVIFREDYLEVYLDRPLEESRLREKADAAGYPVMKID